MARKLNQALWDQWRQRVERQRETGLSIAAFCRREGVSQASFHAWRRKLRSSASARPSRDAATRRSFEMQRGVITPRARRRPSPINSSAATPTANFLQLPVLSARSSPWIELTLVDGTIVRLPQQNLAALHTVLRIVRGAEDEALLREVPHA